MYENWRPRQRGFLQQDGEWDVVSGRENRPCFCVGDQRNEQPRCENIFDQNESVFQGGQWSAKLSGSVGYTKFSKANVQGIDI